MQFSECFALAIKASCGKHSRATCCQYLSAHHHAETLVCRETLRLNRVQRSFTKRLFGMCNISYSDRLTALACTTLSAVWMKVAMLLVFKILHGLIDVDPVAVGLKLRQGRTRGSGVLLEHQCACNRRVNSLFAYRVPLIWETIPTSILNAKSLAVFKKILQQHLSDLCLA